MRGVLNSQYMATAAFSLMVYADALSAAGLSLTCASVTVSPRNITLFAKSQVRPAARRKAFVRSLSARGLGAPLICRLGGVLPESSFSV